jgi:hypothetical protein
MPFVISLHELLAREQKEDVVQQFNAWRCLKPAAGISRAQLTLGISGL